MAEKDSSGAGPSDTNKGLLREPDDTPTGKSNDQEGADSGATGASLEGLEKNGLHFMTKHFNTTGRAKEITQEDFSRHVHGDSKKAFDLFIGELSKTTKVIDDLKVENELRSKNATQHKRQIDALEQMDTNKQLRTDFEATVAELDILKTQLETVKSERDRYLKAFADAIINGSAGPPAADSHWIETLDHPEKLNDGTRGPTFANWEMRVRMKLQFDAIHYPTPARRMAYVVGRTSGLAAEYICPHIRPDDPKRYQDEEDVFKHMKAIFQFAPRATIISR